MKCRVCKKEIDRHSSKQIEECLEVGFGIEIEFTGSVLDEYHLVETFLQPHMDKRHLELVLHDGERIETTTDGLEMTQAILLLTRCYEEPKSKKGEAEEPLPFEEP